PAAVVLVDRDVMHREGEPKRALERGDVRGREPHDRALWLERGAREDGDGPEIRSDLHVAGEVAGHDDEFLRVGEIRGVAVDDDPEAAVYVTAAIAHIDRAVPERDNPAPGTHLHVDAEQREHCPGVVLQPGRAQRRPRLGRALERGIPGTDAPGEVRMLDQLVEDGVRSWLVSAVRGLARSHRWA